MPRAVTGVSTGCLQHSSRLPADSQVQPCPRGSHPGNQRLRLTKARMPERRPPGPGWIGVQLHTCPKPSPDPNRPFPPHNAKPVLSQPSPALSPHAAPQHQAPSASPACPRGAVTPTVAPAAASVYNPAAPLFSSRSLPEPSEDPQIPPEMNLTHGPRGADCHLLKQKSSLLLSLHRAQRLPVP